MATDVYLFLSGGTPEGRREVLRGAVDGGARWSGESAGDSDDFDAFLALELDDTRRRPAAPRRLLRDGGLATAARIRVREPVPCGVKRTVAAPGATGVALISTAPRRARRVFRVVGTRGAVAAAGLGRGPAVLVEIHAPDAAAVRREIERLRRLDDVRDVRGLVVDEVASAR